MMTRWLTALLVAWSAGSLGQVSSQELLQEVSFAIGTESTAGAVGDLDADGYPDFAVGRSVYSGASGVKLFDLYPAGITDVRSVHGVGDVNLDGVPDIGVATSSLATQVRSGSNGALLFSPNLTSCGQTIGQSIRGLGDTNGDGLDDYALTELDLCTLGGSVGVIASGGITSFSTSQIGTCTSVSFPAIAPLGDLDGDGLSDFVSIESDLGSCAPENRVTARRGDGSTIWNLDLTPFNLTIPSAQRSLIELGDTDGDGVRDLAVIFSGATQQTVSIRVLSGASGAFRFELSGWPPTAQLGNPGDTNCDGVADLLISDWKNNTGGTDGGLIRIVSGVDGATLGQLFGQVGDRLGVDLASIGDLNGDGLSDWIAVGSDFARVYSALGVPATNYCSPKTNALGCTPRITSTGLLISASQSPFTIDAFDAPAQKAGLMFWSTTAPATIPFFGGTLCVVPPLVRTPLQFSGGAGNCGGTYSFAFNETYSSSFGVGPGDLVLAQYWMRDPNDSFGFGVGLTDGLALEWCQ